MLSHSEVLDRHEFLGDTIQASMDVTFQPRGLALRTLDPVTFHSSLDAQRVRAGLFGAWQAQPWPRHRVRSPAFTRSFLQVSVLHQHAGPSGQDRARSPGWHRAGGSLHHGPHPPRGPRGGQRAGQALLGGCRPEAHRKLRPVRYAPRASLESGSLGSPQA